MTRVLVPIEVLEGQSVSWGLIELLGTVNVTVLGYHELPEQTPPEQAKEQFEGRANEALSDLETEFRDAGSTVDSRLVFTQDGRSTINRVATEVDADAYTIPGMTGDIARILVPLSGDVAVERILSFVEALLGGRDIGVTLFLASDAEGAGELLDRSATRLREQDISVETRLETGDSPFDALVEAVSGHDAVVMGEKAPSLSSFLFGEETERLATASVGPVLVVRNPDNREA
ncbi:UspA domain protein [Natronomonas pharaonis DSM 2160]|uniref:UspA domain protein n=1 Tax=Natronomonas pharaonis (strain ATCC 35678 / DSM 2160 / CIP 103997 / JCM 8858 / NBRC 14720 / NCIMB 2260 / Gabara) TaxID=348780 RepID=A0A1U7EYY6_NATPD|nr:universal stress protein [Natronomonas pharaonis]CAI50471.1 UspA domain protein [Natronomonas pharaonis DSM 2160]